MKTRQNEFVLQDWVSSLTFQQQALLLTGMRGPDGCNKRNHAKMIVRYLRGVVLKPAGEWNGKNGNDFMWGDYTNWNAACYLFFDDHDEYPHHFIMHLVHCAEVIGYKHHDEQIRSCWKQFYLTACETFHMTPETVEQMDGRLNDFGSSLPCEQVRKEKYGWIKNPEDPGGYTVIHTENGINTTIAVTDNAEKADFISKACNQASMDFDRNEFEKRMAEVLAPVAPLSGLVQECCDLAVGYIRPATYKLAKTNRGDMLL